MMLLGGAVGKEATTKAMKDYMGSLNRQFRDMVMTNAWTPAAAGYDPRGSAPPSWSETRSEPASQTATWEPAASQGVTPAAVQSSLSKSWEAPAAGYDPRGSTAPSWSQPQAAVQ